MKKQNKTTKGYSFFFQTRPQKPSCVALVLVSACTHTRINVRRKTSFLMRGGGFLDDITRESIDTRTHCKFA